MAQAQLPRVITLMGPTASGKTALAMTLAEQHNCEIVSVDSALIYRQMDIGTAKPSLAELQRAPHRLIDIRDPLESYSAADFRQDCVAEIEQILAKGKTPLLVGGTMMYFKTLLDGLSPLPSADERVRAEIQSDVATKGWQALHDELARVDPVAAARIHRNDPQRLSRAIEVYRVSGKTLTELTQVKADVLPYDFVQFAIVPAQRHRLHQVIEQRFQQMLSAGFIEEVAALQQRGDLHLELPSMRCVGYRQCWQYLLGEFDYQSMTEKAIAATRQLAKRQLTWLRGWPELNWLESGADGNLVTLIRQCR